MPDKNPRDIGRQGRPWSELAKRYKPNHSILPSQQAPSAVAYQDDIGTPITTAAQYGITIQRLPDISFQPLGADPINWHIPATSCATLFSSSTVYSRLFHRTIQFGQKIILRNIAMQFSNQYMPANVDIQIKLAGAVLDVPILLNASTELYPFAIVARGKQELEVYGKTKVPWPSGILGKYSLKIDGWQVTDLSRLDERLDR